jgi:hypothetical protein
MNTEGRTMIYRRNIIELVAVCFVALIFGKCEMTMSVYGINTTTPKEG